MPSDARDSIHAHISNSTDPADEFLFLVLQVSHSPAEPRSVHFYFFTTVLYIHTRVCLCSGIFSFVNFAPQFLGLPGPLQI
jgi:hypothetical protein